MVEPKKEIVTNTSPLIAIIAATGNLEILKKLYTVVHVPLEVCEEIVGDPLRFGVEEFNSAPWLRKRNAPVTIAGFLNAVLDSGEASVIQYALDENIATVCIDESVGRRIARLNGLTVTGSLGILIKAKKQGLIINLKDSLLRMRNHGIWIHPALAKDALIAAGENNN